MRPGTEELFPCDAAPAQRLVGRRADRATQAEAMRLTGASSLRIVRPGDALSADYLTDRLTAELDEDLAIIRLYCG